MSKNQYTGVIFSFFFLLQEMSKTDDDKREVALNTVDSVQTRDNIGKINETKGLEE